MSSADRPAPQNDGTLLKRTLVALQELRAKYESLDRARHEPIAIVGIGCRLPGGADSPDALWELLSKGKDGVGPIPSDRWDHERYYHPDGSTPGKMAMRHGAFLRSVDAFDPYFFGISPREAATMDPQQRLFLEVAWHALEDAGIPGEELSGSDAGVFVGANSADYLQLQLAEPEQLDTYSLIGGTGCIIANRLSYLLDLRGPSVTLDTACSSSLVALHQACQSLRSGESSLAIVGGMNVLLSPVVSMAHAKGLPLAADGRCKTFDARADGYVRGEGCVVVVLKRASEARAAGDRVWALIHGSAVNQDGLSNGLTAPNGLAQRAVIRKALANARVPASAVSFVEAHGTGTVLGDPIEVDSLKDVYGRDAGSAEPCALGTIKTNIGHLEAGAGLAGLVKVALSLRHAQIPKNLHFETLNPHLSLEHTRLYVPTELTPWSGARRHGAVSSFGAGGTNAHVVLGAADSLAEEAPASAAPGPYAYLLSARSASALKTLARAHAEYLESEQVHELPWVDLCRAAALRRTHHKHRLALVASSQGEAARLLAAFAAGASVPGVRMAVVEAPTRVMSDAVGYPHEPAARAQLIADAYVAGSKLELRTLFGTARHVALPLYPFEREPYWFKERERSTPAQPDAQGALAPTPSRVAASVPAEQAACAPSHLGIDGASERELVQRLRTLVHAEVARVLRFNPSRLDPKRGFFDLGMDSIMATQLKNALERQLGRKMPTTLILEHPSVEALSLGLTKLLRGESAPSVRAPVRPKRFSSSTLRVGAQDDVAALLLAELESI